MTSFEEQRVYAGWPSKRETLNCYLEELNCRLDSLEISRSHDFLSEKFDRDFFSYARYHYYEVLWAERVTAQDLLYAIAEVKEKLWRLDDEEGISHDGESEEQIEGQIVMIGFPHPASLRDMAFAS